MAYKYDVFVSYAHVDDEPLLKDAEGWVRTLVRKLKVTLSQEVRGAPVEVWMDPRLAGNRPFEDDIVEGLDQSAALLIIMSRRYADSYWCQREQNTFRDKVRRRSSSRTRIFVVEKNKLQTDQKLPDEFLGLSRYQFWYEDDISKRVKTFGEPAPKEDEEGYWSELYRLTQDLAEELNKLRQLPEEPAGNFIPAAGGEATPAVREKATAPVAQVFLAEVTDDLRRRYHEVKSYLEQYGIEVLPKKPYDRRDRAAYKQAMLADLGKCALFVQVLSGVTGETDEEFPGYPAYQYDIARSLAIPLYQWRHKDLKMEEADSDEQVRLLNLSSVRAEPIEDFKKAVLKAALDAAKPKSDRSLRPPGNSVFIDTDVCDWALAQGISQSLLARGISSFLPIPRDTPNLTVEQITQDFQESLKVCDGLIVVYGQSPVTWVRGRFRLGTKVLAQRSPPLVGIYLAPPCSIIDHGVQVQRMLSLDCRGNPSQPDETALNRFVETLRGQQA